MSSKEIEFKFQKAINLLTHSFSRNDVTTLIESIDLFQEIINLDSKNIDAYLCLGYISYILENKKHADFFLKKVLDLDPLMYNQVFLKVDEFILHKVI